MNRSFIMSNLSKSLFWYEQPEQFAHSHSFVLSDMSKSLTVAHLIWAIWVNEQMSRAGNSLIWFPSESLVFCPKMSEWAIFSKKWVIHSFAHVWWAKWVICHIAHFLWGTWANHSWSLIFGKRNEQFTHIAHLIWAKWAIHSQKRGNEQKWVIS